MILHKRSYFECKVFAPNTGDPSATRTRNQLIKSQLLCRIELTGHAEWNYTPKVYSVNVNF